MTVGLQTGEEDVKEPEAEQEGWRGQSVSPGPAQFSSDVGPAPIKQHRDGQEGEDGEESDGEGQRASFHHKRFAFTVPVDGRHRPGHADSQEDVDGVAAGHIPNRGVCVGVLNCCYLTGKGVCGEGEREGAWFITLILKPLKEINIKPWPCKQQSHKILNFMFSNNLFF